MLTVTWQYRGNSSYGVHMVLALLDRRQILWQYYFPECYSVASRGVIDGLQPDRCSCPGKCPSLPL
jgi:hypothetical protein